MVYGVIGNTTVFGAVFQGSSPCKPTNIKLRVYFLRERPTGSLFFIRDIPHNLHT